MLLSQRNYLAKQKSKQLTPQPQIQPQKTKYNY